ncbi:MAG: alpha/beta hydrolase [Spirulina sp. DLM2.Bin59]|nr:MAG: alpha/beta hydrolase [Spirulina sp. DLM2.Bin59]
MDREQWRRLLIGELSWARLGRSLLFIYAFFALYVFFMADRMIFVPQPASYGPGTDLIPIATPQSQLIQAIHRPNPDATHTILYSHGNAEDLGDIAPILDILYNAGFSVFAYDYRGYGRSEGRPSEANAYEDIEAAYQYLVTVAQIPPSEIILLGRSVGGGPSVDLATRHPVGGLILESTFTQAFRTVVPFPLLPFDKFRNIAKIGEVNAPILIIHGTADEAIPFSHGQQLYAAAPEPKRSLWVEGAGHNDLVWVAGETYGETLQAFSQSLTAQD